jgi:hypothetical protein
MARARRTSAFLLFAAVRRNLGMTPPAPPPPAPPPPAPAPPSPPPGTLTEIPLPVGSLSFTAGWNEEAGADGYALYLSANQQPYPDRALYEYVLLIDGGSTTSLVVSNVAAGPWHGRIAPVVNGVPGPLLNEVTFNPE